MSPLREKHYHRKLKELSLLYEISQHLDRSADLNLVLSPVLQNLTREMELTRSAVTLLNRQTEQIQIEEAYGLTPEEQDRGRYNPGEGVIGQVIESGQPVVVPDISRSPGFLGKTEKAASLSDPARAFLCVPIKIENTTIGTLSAHRPHPDEVDLEEDLKLLSIIGSMIAQAVKVRRRVQEEKERNAQLQAQLEDKFRPGNIIGNSRAMQEVFDLIGQVSHSEATVLIRGESGTGKELVANAIHYNSPRTDKPFVKVNCAALPESVIESELFGHEKGAFTSAVATRKGRFELAHGGTIFLDEIGDLSVMTQIKLLRVLQEKEFERVGGTRPIKTDVRVIAATNRPLEEMMSRGEFREDLYYRLNVFPIHIPPLRDRKSDIIQLADHFTEKYGRSSRIPIKRISTPAIELFMTYHWPGNVRELENCIERAALLSTDGVIHGHHLPPSLQSAESTGTQPPGSLDAALSGMEKEMIKESLKSTRGNRAKAARLLGITERQMGTRIAKYRIKPERYRN